MTGDLDHRAHRLPGKGDPKKEQSIVSSSAAAGSGERVAQVKRLEFPEITVIGVQRADAVLEQDGYDVGVRDEVPANGGLARHLLVGIQETVQLRHGTHVRQPDERGDVPERFIRRQRR